MVTNREKGILLCILKHCRRIERKMSNLSREEFDSNEDIREIICFNVFQIGELVKGLSPEFISEHKTIPWKDIKGMRDIIGHGYGTIDNNIVWKTAATDIKPLSNYCEKIIKTE